MQWTRAQLEMPGGKCEGVLVAAFQSEREEETRD
jgi:hypothetical protein